MEFGSIFSDTLYKLSRTQTFNKFKYYSIFLIEIKAYSCKLLLSDPPASKGDALKQLRLKALEMGANGIVDVTFDSRGTDAFGTNCWESVQVTGVAVKFE